MADAQRIDEDPEQLVCYCNEVDIATIRAAIQRGARDLDSIAKATHATTGCGTCRFEIEEMLDATAQSAPESDT